MQWDVNNEILLSDTEHEWRAEVRWRQTRDLQTVIDHRRIFFFPQSGKTWSFHLGSEKVFSRAKSGIGGLHVNRPFRGYIKQTKFTVVIIADQHHIKLHNCLVYGEESGGRQKQQRFAMPSLFDDVRLCAHDMKSRGRFADSFALIHPVSSPCSSVSA